MTLNQKQLRLSNTSTNMFNECGMRYKFHYVDKIRSKYINSSLFFGSAIDDALNTMLESKLKDNPKFGDWLAIFNNKMSFITHNDKEVFLDENIYCVYAKSDYDKSLLSAEEKMDISKGFSLDLDQFIEDFFTKRKQVRGDQSSMVPEEVLLANRACHACLHKKGIMLLKTYEQEIMHKIDYVIAVQRDVNLPNERGDVLVGKIDAILKFKSDPTIYITDNKTSSRPYTSKEIEKSKQLATYAEHENNFNVCYIVLEKNIRRTEPRVRYQIMRHTLPNELIEEVFIEYENTLNKISNNVFDKNEKVCYNIFGKPCEYISLCKYGIMNKNLVDLKGEKK